jgi:glucokinase
MTRAWTSICPIHPKGNADFPATVPWELDLVDFIKAQDQGRRAISYEDLLSGKGVERIYRFLRQTRQIPLTEFTLQIDGAREKAQLISQFAAQDETCRETFHLFIQLYAKCARNFALEALALGGVYLAGGILVKNAHHLSPDLFRRHFEENDRHKELLQKIPIKVLVNYDVSLYGAVFAASLHEP